eukprot:1153554-Pelagomonas_calceolata.AAC.1
MVCCAGCTAPVGAAANLSADIGKSSAAAAAAAAATDVSADLVCKDFRKVGAARILASCDERHRA